MQVLRLYFKESELVVSTTRYPRPRAQAAENITVITAREIEAMNAHTLAEALNRVPGVFVNFNRDFGATSLIDIQGSEMRHVLVLLDGVPWNFLASGAAETNSIPVGIIDRVEIVKGPASSAWGSSLGGVINILTKSTGKAAKPSGSVRASYGESGSQEYRAQVAGSAGLLGYYLFGGWQKSDGLVKERSFENPAAYFKLDLPVSDELQVQFTSGYSEPSIGFGEFPGGDITTQSSNRAFFTTASLAAALSETLEASASFYHFKQKSAQISTTLGLGFAGPPGSLFQEGIFDEEKTGARGKIVWKKERHTGVLGFDLEQGKLRQKTKAGELLQSFGIPASSYAAPDINRWAVYANDAIALGRLTITPSLRYDHDTVIGSFISPSLGLAYALRHDTLLRAAVSRGFTTPPLSWSSGGALFLDPNPSLKEETVWSYQAGCEFMPARQVKLKGSLFRHELRDAMRRELFSGGPPAFNDLIVNKGKSRRQGAEIEVETLPVHHLAFQGGLVYVDLDPSNENGSDSIYSLDLGIRYSGKRSLWAELHGRYVWWDLDETPDVEYDDFIWDLNVSKRIQVSGEVSTELFLTAHNLFDGVQYANSGSENPGRWLEAGIRIGF